MKMIEGLWCVENYKREHPEYKGNFVKRVWLKRHYPNMTFVMGKDVPDSLFGVTNCQGSCNIKNCIDCVDCDYCENCKSCVRCSSCHNCSKCMNCIGCNHCHNCFNCDGGHDLLDWENCYTNSIPGNRIILDQIN